MPYCGEQTLVKHVGAARHARSLLCHSWTCPDCSDSRKRGLIAQAISGAPNLFLTLTIRRTGNGSPDQAAKTLARCWRLVRLRILRRYGWKRLPFLAVFEPHKSGWPHLHILLRSAFIDITFIRSCMSELADSPQVYIEWIDNRGRVAGYCAKYCGKGAAKFGTAKRYWLSRDYDTRPKPEKTWKMRYDASIYVVPTQLEKLISVYITQGWSLVRPSVRSAIFQPPSSARAPPSLAAGGL